MSVPPPDGGGRRAGGHTRRAAAAVVAGAVLGATASAATALLLYTGHGFLRAAGLLVSSTIMALAAGVWAGGDSGGSPAPGHAAVGAAPRGRWIALLGVLVAAGVFCTYWRVRPAVHDVPAAGALAVLLLLAAPAYAAGSALSGLAARERVRLPHGTAGGIAAAAAAGAALGVLLATTVLIQALEPYAIYYGAAGFTAAAALLDTGADPPTRHSGDLHMIDHVALITGIGERGQLGYAIARRFLAAGARVVVTSRSEAIDELAAELAEEGTVIPVRADLLADHDVKRLVDAVSDRFDRLDSLINVAGGLTVMGPVAETSPEAWDAEVERNTGTALRMCRAALPLLRASRGAIINFASPAGARAVAGLGAYSAAKAGVIALTRTLAIEEKGNGVRVNAVAPGMVDTAQNRATLGEVDEATFVAREDVAEAVLFLAGPGARGISGETVHVTGPAPD